MKLYYYSSIALSILGILIYFNFVLLGVFRDQNVFIVFLFAMFIGGSAVRSVLGWLEDLSNHE